MMTDTELLDYLEALPTTYTGRWILRLSSTGRGWRLHETSDPKAQPTVREAIAVAVTQGLGQSNKGTKEPSQ